MNHEISELIGKSEIGRRSFIEGTATSMLGVSLSVPFLNGINGKAFGQSKKGGTAKNLIYVYLSGGMSHLDTFDPKKEGSNVAGPTKPISTNGDFQLGDRMEKLAGMADKFAVINNMSSTQGAHDQGNYYMRTAYTKRATIVHPTMGPLAEEYLGRRNEILPDSVVIGSSSSNAGYLDPSRAPLPIANPGGGVPNTNIGGSEERFDRRMKMAQKLGTKFTDKYKYVGPQSYVEYYDQANTLLKSNALDAFNLTGEKNREKYGMGRLGQGCLLAKRLVKNGVRVIEVISGGWDMHSNIDDGLDTRVPELDQALAALLEDLDSEGMLGETLVAVGTEFGRTPNINMNSGRDHYPAAFSTMLAGGGVQGGMKYGETTKEGKTKNKGDVVSPKDFISTIGYALGIPKDEIYAPNGRPFKFGHDGQAATRLFG